jgi:hypothetical protein
VRHSIPLVAQVKRVATLRFRRCLVYRCSSSQGLHRHVLSFAHRPRAKPPSQNR